MSLKKRWITELALEVKAGQVTADQACDIVRGRCKTILTLNSRMSDLKKEIQRIGGDPKGIGKTREEAIRASATQTANLVTASENIEEVRAAPLIQWARSILRQSPIAAPSPEQLACALAIVTGRRQAEILVTASFEKVDDRHVMFAGQIKKRDVDTTPYKIPVLTPADEVIAALAVVKAKYGHLVVANVSKSPCQTLAKVVGPLTGGKLTFRDLRMMYALVSCESERPHMCSTNAHVARVLGHANMESSVAYTKMRIVDMTEAVQEVRK